jgi:hypothetical protein
MEDKKTKPWSSLTRIVIDHQTHIVHVDPAGQDVGGDQHVGFAIAKVGHGGITVGAFDLAVQDAARIAGIGHGGVDHIGRPDRFDEYNRLANGQQRIDIGEKLELATIVASRVDP